MQFSDFKNSANVENVQYPYISIVMPAFNEESTIRSVISETISTMKLNRLPFEIIVVDDCSTDRTFDEASQTGALVISNVKNRGKGYCFREGLEKAQGNVIVALDADGEHKPRDITRILGPVLNGTDAVAGSRFINGTTDFTSRTRYVGNQLFNFAIMLLTGRKVTDSQTGFRAFKRDVVEKLLLKSDGYQIETEMTVKLLRNGFTLMEIPISVRHREFGFSRIRLFSDGMKILKTIISAKFAEVGH